MDSNMHKRCMESPPKGSGGHNFRGTQFHKYRSLPVAVSGKRVLDEAHSIAEDDRRGNNGSELPVQILSNHFGSKIPFLL